MPIFILAGEEELLLSERLESIRENLLDPAWVSFNYSVITKPDLKQIADAAAAIPFGPGNKVILFDQCDLFTKKKAGKAEDESAATKGKASKREKTLDDLDKALAAVAPLTYLVFSCNSNFDKTLKVSKIFEKYAKIETFEKPKYWGNTTDQIYNWARKRAHKYGAVIDDEAIDYLTESSEANLRAMASEIEKAAIYILPEKHITLEIISHLSPHFSGVFALLDHWIHGERQQVLASIQEILSKQPSAVPVISILQTTLTKWVNIKAAADRVIASLPAGRGIQRRDIPAAELSKKLQSEIKINPWVLKNDLERIHKIKLEFLVQKKQELTRLETALKTGLITDVHALSIFFTT